MLALQKAGVPAGVCQTAGDRCDNDPQLQALEEYVRTGGGLLLFPGNRVDSAWWNAKLYREGEGLLPAMLGPLAGQLKPGLSGSAIIGQRFDHAALEFFNDPRNGTLADSAVRVWFKLDEASARAARPPRSRAGLTVFCDADSCITAPRLPRPAPTSAPA